MVQKMQLPNSDNKRILEFNNLDLRNILEEISKPSLFLDLNKRQVISTNHLFSELVDMGIVDISGLSIYELIPQIDIEQINDGETIRVSIARKKSQPLDLKMTSRFVSRSENLLLLIFDENRDEEIENANPLDDFVNGQTALLPRLFEISFSELLDEIIKIGKQITQSDEVVFYLEQENLANLNRFPLNSTYFPEQVPAIELSRIKEIDFWEPGRRVLSEIHRVGRLNKFNSIITIPIFSNGQHFGLIIAASRNTSDFKTESAFLDQFSVWVSSTIGLYRKLQKNNYDLSTIRENAEKLEIFFNNSSDSLLLLDGKNQILEFNSNFLKLLDYLPIEILNKPVGIIFDNSPILDLLINQQDSNIESFKVPVEIFDRHGNKKVVYTKVINYGLGDKEKKLVILKDATEQISLENDISMLQKNAVLGEMLSEFAHDVRNIINRLTTGLQLIIKKTNPDESVLLSFQNLQNDYIGVIDLMESVLSFSKQNYELFKKENVKDIVERIIYQSQKKASQLNISLILKSKDSDCLAWIDQRSLERVLINIINNGIEAIGFSGGTLSVNLSNSEEHTGYLLVQIADTGPGIPPEIESNLYKKYSSGKPEGTGLGLFISQKIIEFHKGWINIETFPGGTIFNIFIPKEKRGDDN
jgi:two-component system, NtrC family, sensor histidine kinase AtoS